MYSSYIFSSQIPQTLTKAVWQMQDMKKINEVKGIYHLFFDVKYLDMDLFG